jgi:hypothetical protein
VFVKDSGVSCKLSEQTVPSCSLEECGRYLETIKVYENKPADIIREHTDNDYLSRVCTSPRQPCRNNIFDGDNLCYWLTRRTVTA